MQAIQWYLFFFFYHHTHDDKSNKKISLHNTDTMDYHTQQLSKHCRVCCKTLTKAKGKCTVYNCADYKDQLLATFGVNLSNDSDVVHPTNFCSCCYTITKCSAKASQDGVPYTPLSMHISMDRSYNLLSGGLEDILSNYNIHMQSFPLLCLRELCKHC